MSRHRRVGGFIRASATLRPFLRKAQKPSSGGGIPSPKEAWVSRSYNLLLAQNPPATLTRARQHGWALISRRAHSCTRN
ncbi:hypothetical protein SKAU_G00355070 [Synaphobranchus kaupii]|uniref:Uncharacterized protein n=1 Tax=Synaphobranchus kaupii TaxID=118154 RepID=A0A9Q1EH46_SYNKA|nr:hypothetical protein SKAU_G00355070 [Synaphobranchus kaupii]